MARIKIGVGIAHTPQIHTQPQDWAIRGDRDRADGLPLWYRGKRYLYAELIEARTADGTLAEPLGPTEANERLDRCFTAIDHLADVFADTDVDAAVICGNDQHELFHRRTQPAVSVIGADPIRNGPRTAEQAARLPPGIALSDHGHLPPEWRDIPGSPALAETISRQMTANSIDVNHCFEVPRVDDDHSLLSGVPHAFGFVYRNLMRDAPVPNVPIVINSFFPPNQPSARRCFEYGRTIAAAIDSWDSDTEVAIVASGGLSHFVIDEEFDRRFLDALARRDFEEFLSLGDEWYQTGTSECKNWLVAAGALSTTDLTMEIVDYTTLPRTEGGTGSSCAFTIWR